jgi:hypothetical protein
MPKTFDSESLRHGAGGLFRKLFKLLTIYIFF